MLLGSGLLLRANSTWLLLMQLMVRSEVEPLLLLSEVNSLELHLLLLRKVQLKLLLLGLQELHLVILLRSPKTLLLK